MAPRFNPGKEKKTTKIRQTSFSYTKNKNIQNNRITVIWVLKISEHFVAYYVHNFVSYLFSGFGGGSGATPDPDTASTASDATITLFDHQTVTNNLPIPGAVSADANLPSVVLSSQASTQMYSSVAFNSLNNFN